MSEKTFTSYCATITNDEEKELTVGNYIIYNQDANKGFNFGYILYIPDDIREYSTLIVEGANTRRTADTIEQEIEDLQNRVLNFATISLSITFTLYDAFNT